MDLLFKFWRGVVKRGNQNQGFAGQTGHPGGGANQAHQHRSVMPVDVEKNVEGFLPAGDEIFQRCRRFSHGGG